MGQALIFSTVEINNQPVTHPTGRASDKKFTLNKVGIGLLSDKFCSKGAKHISGAIKTSMV